MSKANPRTVQMMFSTLVILALPLLATAQFGFSQEVAVSAADTISVLSSSSFRDDIGAYHIVGEVKNNSPAESVKYVRTGATLYDNAGKVLGTDFTFTDVNVLRPAEKSSFKIILSDLGQSQKVTSYKLSTSAVRTQALPASLKLTITESHLDTIGAYHIVGKVTNHGSQKATFVKVSGAFYNRTHVVVAADYAYTEPKDLEPGQTAPFEIIVTSATSAHQITYASLNADSIQYSAVGHNETS